MSHYVEYYTTQVGGSGISKVYVGSKYQRGHGIGSFLGGLFRRVLPILTRGARTVGKEALLAGVNVLNDVDNKIPLKQAFKSRFKESGQNLKRKAVDKIENLMSGSGYKIAARNLTGQLNTARRGSRIAGVKRKKNIRKGVKRLGQSKVKKNNKKRTKKKKTRKTTMRKTAKKQKRGGLFGRKNQIIDIFGNK